MNDKAKVQVWSFGGGTQSCAIAALIIQGKLPKPDIAVIADTGYETGATWEYKEKVIDPAMDKIGIKIERVLCVEWAAQWAKNGIFTGEKLDAVLIPVFSTIEMVSAEKPSKLKNFCTRAWKTEVIDRWLSRTRKLTRSKARKWIGFSSDEPIRYLRMMEGEEFKKGLLWFPLVDGCRLSRWECIRLVESMGWPTPPRSACYMCPNHRDHEWRKLKKERPDEFQKAVEIEREIQRTDPNAWLHRSCIPLDQVDFSEEEDLFSRPCDSGQCFV